MPKMPLTVKLAPALRQRLERAAKKSTRSLSAEVETRLNESFIERLTPEEKMVFAAMFSCLRKHELEVDVDLRVAQESYDVLCTYSANRITELEKALKAIIDTLEETPAIALTHPFVIAAIDIARKTRK